MKLFEQTADLSAGSSFNSDTLKNLPEKILKHTDWDYSYEHTEAGCFLKPTFRNMPYRNSFVPEIDIVVSKSDTENVLHLKGQPTKPVRIFMMFWFSFALLMEAFLLIPAITYGGWSVPLLIPVFMCVCGYFLCQIVTKMTFNAVVKVIRKEFL